MFSTKTGPTFENLRKKILLLDHNVKSVRYLVSEGLQFVENCQDLYNWMKTTMYPVYSWQIINVTFSVNKERIYSTLHSEGSFPKISHIIRISHTVYGEISRKIVSTI